MCWTNKIKYMIIIMIIKLMIIIIITITILIMIIIIIIIYDILLSDINYFNKKSNDNVRNIGIDVPTNIHVIIRIQFKL